MTFLLTAHCMENGERIVDLNSLREKSRFKYKPERCGPVPDWTSSPDRQRRADHLCTDGRRSRTSGRRRRRRRRRDTRQKNTSTLLGILTHSTIEISPFFKPELPKPHKRHLVPPCMHGTQGGVRMNELPVNSKST